MPETKNGGLQCLPADQIEQGQFEVFWDTYVAQGKADHTQKEHRRTVVAALFAGWLVRPGVPTAAITMEHAALEVSHMTTAVVRRLAGAVDAEYTAIVEGSSDPN